MEKENKSFALEILQELTKRKIIYKTIAIISLITNVTLLIILFKIRG